MVSDFPFHRAQARLVTALIDASDHAGDFAEDLADGEPYAPGELIHAARCTRVKSLAVLLAAVHTELAAGHGWAQVAEGLGLTEDQARQMYEPGYLTWRAELTEDTAATTAPAPVPAATTAPAPGRRTWPPDLAGTWSMVAGWRARRRPRGL